MGREEGSSEGKKERKVLVIESEMDNDHGTMRRH
jgi:hypothetical protein